MDNTDKQSEITDTEVEVPVVKKKVSLGRKILGLLWDTLDDSPVEERKFVFKLDTIFLSWSCVYYFLMYLDSTNVSNAYVSGMKEDLNMYGNELNYVNTFRIVGYVIGTMPAQFLLLKVRPSIVLPTLEISWSLLVLGMAFVKNIHAVYALRFFVGFFESAAYPGMMALLGNWYTPKELGKRSVIYQQSSAVAQMFSGFMQAGIYTGLSGHGGLKGWRWLFIIDGIIGIPVACAGYFIIPDSPHNTKVLWLNNDQKEIAKDRMQRIGRAPAVKLTWRKLYNTAKAWPFWTFIIPYVCFVLAVDLSAFMTLWLKWLQKYSVTQVNVIPSGGFAVEIVVALFMAILSDATGKRWLAILLSGLLGMIGALILVGWPESLVGMYFGWYLVFTPVGAGAILFAWINELCQEDAEMRTILLAAFNTTAYVFNAWLPIFIYPSGKAPKYPVGYKLNAVFWGIFALAGVVGPLIVKKMGKPRKINLEPTSSGSSIDEISTEEINEHFDADAEKQK